MWVSLTTSKHLTLDVWHGFEYVSAPRDQKKKFISFHLSFGDQNTFPSDLVTGNSDFDLRENFRSNFH